MEAHHFLDRILSFLYEHKPYFFDEFRIENNQYFIVKNNDKTFFL